MRPICLSKGTIMSISDKFKIRKTDRFLRKIEKATLDHANVYLREAEKNMHDEEAFKIFTKKAIDLMDIAHEVHNVRMKDR